MLRLRLTVIGSENKSLDCASCVSVCAPRGSEGDKMLLMNKEDFTQVVAKQ